MSGYKYSRPSDYLDPILPTAIKKRGWRVGIIVSGEVKRERLGWGVGWGPKDTWNKRRGVCAFGDRSLWWRGVGGTRRLSTHMEISSLASQFCVKCGGSVMYLVSERTKRKALVKIKFDHNT